MIGWAMTVALLTAQASTTVPSAEAERLGRQLAETGTLAALLPLMIAKETDDLVKDHANLSPADQAELRRIAAGTGRTGKERLLAAEGRAYARALSVSDLRALVAFHQSPAALRWRKAQPGVIAATMQGAEGIDFKKDVMTAFCAKSGKGCAK